MFDHSILSKNGFGGGMASAIGLRVKLATTILAFLFLAVTQGIAQLSSQGTEFPFQLREGLIWIQVSVPQCGKTLNFMLDSGAEVSVVDLRVAQSLGLKWGNLVSVRGVKSSVNGYWPEHLSAQLGDISLPKDFLAVNLSDLSKACKCGVDGLLGADFFKGRIVQIDFQKQKIRLLKSANPGAHEESIPLQVRSSGMLVKIQVNNGKAQKVRLDTGCASPLQWVSSKAPSEPYARQIAVGMTEVSIPLIRTSVRIGESEFTSVPTGLQDHQIFAGEAGLVGTPLLSRFAVVTVDTLAKRLLLRRY
jgi:hypothetical protein